MKKLFLSIILCAAAGGLQAHPVTVRGLKAQRQGETVHFNFTAVIDRKASRGGMTAVYAPVITDGTYRVSFPAIVVQGRRAAKSWERHEWANNEQARYENAVYSRNGQIVDYTASVPFQLWMYDSRIEVETVTAGCCTTNSTTSVLAHNILPAPPPAPVSEPEPVATVPEPTTGERLAATFPFVLSASEFDENEPIRFYDDERDNALTVYYRVNSRKVDESYADNRQTLINLTAAIDLLRTSTDSDVARIVVAGFASPEGSFEANDRLAFDRAEAIEKYVMEHCDLPQSAVILFNGSADWRGLRLLIAADENVPGRWEALDIIDNHPVWDTRTQTGRQMLLRNLNGGRTYRYLTDHIFPKLRNGTFIRIYFKNKTEQK